MKTSGIVLAVCIAGMTTTVAFCAERPDIIRHDAQYLDRAVSIHVEWQSPNPVTKVNISVGSQVKEVAVDEYDNRRNPYGYQGEVSVTLPVEPQLLQPGVPYVIQLEDDLRQKSAVVSGKASIQPTLPPGSTPLQQQDDNWGKGHLAGMSTPQLGGTTGTALLIGSAVGLYNSIDSAPTVDAIKVNILSPENVSFTTRANDDKALQELRVKVYNGVGTLVGFQSLTGLGKVWQGTSKTFTLGGGSYRVVIQAVDNAGNTSIEQVASFPLSGRPMELQTVQETPPITPTAPVSQTPSEQSPKQTEVPTPNVETLQPQVIPGL